MNIQEHHGLSNSELLKKVQQGDQRKALPNVSSMLETPLQTVGDNSDSDNNGDKVEASETEALDALNKESEPKTAKKVTALEMFASVNVMPPI